MILVLITFRFVFMNFISQPWPWYVAGPIIGLTVPVLLVLTNKSFGISSTLRDFCAMCMPNTSIRFFKYDWKSNSWALFFVLGIMIGAFLVSHFIPNKHAPVISESTLFTLQKYGIYDASSLLPSELFSWSKWASPVSLVVWCIGGFLVGFGTRYAGGCTSGHAIMGLSMFKRSSLVAVIGFFIGGLTMTWLILPHILSWL